MEQAKRARNLVQKALQALSEREDLAEERGWLEDAVKVLNPLADGIQVSDKGDPASVALRSVLKNQHVPAELQMDLASMAEDLEEVGEGARPRLYLGMFRLLKRWSLLDPELRKESTVSFHKAGTWLAGELQKLSYLTVERLEQVTTLAAAHERCGAENVEVVQVLARAGGPELVRVHRPCVRVEDAVHQKALVLKGVPTDDAAAIGFDEVLFHTEDRLKRWEAEMHPRVRGMLSDVQRQILERALKRIGDVRTTMRAAAAAGSPVAPPETARRDMIKLAIDMVHRIQDTLATLPQHRDAYRGAFAELVFQDVVFRQLVPYLSREFGIDLDTALVEGADVQPLAGRYKVEKKGPKPKHPNTKVFSVVVPGYLMGGTNIRPASVRLGLY